MRGIGELADETAGELTETNLNIISNDECYKKLSNVTQKFTKIGISYSLFDGITDQIICTTTACNPDEVTRENRFDKCVS